MADSADKLEPVIVKKYANRRLYNTDSSSYITLEHLAAMTREGRDFKVVDAKSGDDITHQVLTQIIMEEESHGTTLLPISFLRQVISMYGDSMQSMVPHYLEASMSAFSANQAKFRDAMKGAFGTGTGFPSIEQLAKQNLAMFQAAAEMMAGRGGPAAQNPPPAAPAQSNDELATLRDQMSALQAQLDRIAKR